MENVKSKNLFWSFPQPRAIVAPTWSFPKNITARDLSANCRQSEVIIFVHFEGVEVKTVAKTVAKNSVHQQANQKFCFRLSYDLFAGNYQRKNQKEALKIAPCKLFFYF